MERRSLLGEYRTADGSPALPDGNGVRASLLDEYEPIQPSLLDDYQDTPSLLDEYRPGEAIGEVVGAGLSGSGGIDLRDDPIIRAQLEKWGAYESIPLTESLPRVAAAGLGIAVPASIPAQVVGGLLLSSAARGTTAALEGEDVLAAANPLNNKMESLLDVAIPVGTGAITRGMRAPRLDQTLPDFQRATSANADLPPVDDIVGFREVTTENVPRASVEPTTAFGRFRQHTMNPTRWLQRSEDVAASAQPGYAKSTRRISGDTLEGFSSMYRQIREQGQHELNDIFRGMGDDDLVLTGRVMNQEVPIEDVPEHVAAAARRAWAWRDQIGARAERIEDMMTRNPATGELYHFARLGEPSFPRIPDRTQMADTVRFEGRATQTNRVNPTQTSRLADNPEHAPPIIYNAHEALTRYLDNFSRDMAASHYFGSRAGGSVWGERADRIHEMLVAEGDGRAAKAFSSRMNKTMNPLKTDEEAWLANAIAQRTAQITLPLAPITSWSQAGTNLMRNGFSNTVEGMTRWMRDPSMHRMYDSSGALNAGFTEMAEGAGVSPRSLTARWMRGTERGLRGILNAGTVPYAEDVVRRVQGGARDRTTLRQLRELGIELAEAEGGMTADMMRRIVQRSSDKLQLQAHDPMNAGPFFDSPRQRAAFQFMQYPAEATRLAHDMVFDPIVQGVRNLDPREAMLGVSRAAKWVPATAAAAGVGEVARASLVGREPKPENVIYNTAESIFPPAGAVTSWMRGYDMPGLGAAPAVGVTKQAIQSGARLFGDDPERGLLELAADLAAATDPTGASSLARQLIRTQTKEAYK